MSELIKSKKEKVVIVVRGGIVQDVYANPNTEVYIYDFDDESYESPSEEDLKNDIKDLIRIV